MYTRKKDVRSSSAKQSADELPFSSSMFPDVASIKLIDAPLVKLMHAVLRGLKI